MDRRTPAHANRFAVAAATFAGVAAAASPAAAAPDLLSLCLATLGAVTPARAWSAWSLAPATLGPLVLLLAVYLAATRREASPGRTAAFVAGWLLLAVALVSPLCRMAATLVSAHMLQHMLLVIAAPLLLAAGGIGPALRGVLPDRAARRIAPAGRIGLAPVGVVYGAAIWLWHAPPIYTAILTDPVTHVTALALLATVATWFWCRVLAGAAQRPGSAVAAVFFAMVHTGLLGALLTFASEPLYPVLAAGGPLWGLTALDDQQLAGLVMWVPGGLAYLAVAVALSTAALARDDAGADADGFDPRPGTPISLPSVTRQRST